MKDKRATRRPTTRRVARYAPIEDLTGDGGDRDRFNHGHDRASAAPSRPDRGRRSRPAIESDLANPKRQTHLDQHLAKPSSGPHNQSLNDSRHRPSAPSPNGRHTPWPPTTDAEPTSSL